MRNSNTPEDCLIQATAQNFAYAIVDILHFSERMTYYNTR